MSPRIVRGQLALDVGDRLKDLGAKVLLLHEYSGEALRGQLRSVETGIDAQLNHLETLVKSCRVAKNSYPNFPALRRAIALGGDECYEIQQEVLEAKYSLVAAAHGGAVQLPLIGRKLVELGQRLRMVHFVPPESKPATSEA